MTKVAFCDDDLSVIETISVLINQYRVKRNLEIEYAAFQSPFFRKKKQSS